MKLRDVVHALSAQVLGDDTLEVTRVVHPADAIGPGDLALATSKDAVSALDGCQAEAVIVSEASAPLTEKFKAVIVAGNERMVLSVVTALFDPGPAHLGGIHPTAVIAPDALIAAGASIGPFAVIGARSRVGAGSKVLPHVTIGQDVAVGADCLIHSGVRFGDRVNVGDRVIVHHNASLGSDGFSFIPARRPSEPSRKGGLPTRIHSVGRIVVEDDVEIGAGTTIDRATLRETRIGRGTKIDNMVHIGHNVTIGESCLICGMVGISGSVRIGDRVMIGGGVGVADHLTIGSDSAVAAGSGVGTNVAPGTVVSGYPAMPHERSLRNFMLQGRLPALNNKVTDLQSRIEALEQTKRGRSEERNDD